MTNPMEMGTIPQAKSPEQSEAEAYKAKLEKVEAEMTNLGAYKGELADLNEQKADIEKALVTEGNPEIDAMKEDLKSHLADLEKAIEPVQSKVRFLDTINNYRNEQAWSDMASGKVDEITAQLTPILKDDFMLAKSTFYQQWYDVRNANGEELKGGRFQVQDMFPISVSHNSLNFGWQGKYPEQMFRAGDGVEIGKKYPWKEAMGHTKKYYADRKESFGKAVENKIKETTLI